jgi:hypothetical protein
MSGQTNQGSMSCDHGTKNWSHLEKSLAQQTEQGPNLGRQRLWMLYELSAWCPQSLALSWELLGEKFRLPRLVDTTHTHDDFKCPSPRDYVDTKS